jgi:hypothetical protein
MGLTDCPHRTSLRISKAMLDLLSKAMLDLRLSSFRVSYAKKMAR